MKTSLVKVTSALSVRYTNECSMLPTEAHILFGIVSEIKNNNQRDSYIYFTIIIEYFIWIHQALPDS